MVFYLPLTPTSQISSSSYFGIFWYNCVICHQNFVLQNCLKTGRQIDCRPSFSKDRIFRNTGFFCKNLNRYFCLAHRSGPFQWRDTLTPFELLVKHCNRIGQKIRLVKGTPEIIHIGEDSDSLEDLGIGNVLFFLIVKLNINTNKY